MSDDYWFYRNRQLDWKDQQDATERELERIRLRSGSTRRGADTGESGGESGLDAHSSGIVAQILKTRGKLLDEVRQLSTDRWRIERWESVLREPGPWERRNQRRLRQVRHEVESMLNTGPGMFLIRKELESIRSMLDDLDTLIGLFHEATE